MATNQRRTNYQPIQDLVGRVFGRLTVIAYAGPAGGGHHFWLCRCECGNTCKVRRNALMRGMQVSCGCFNSERTIATHRKHGHSSRNNDPTRTPEHSSWHSMLSRCLNSMNISFKNYGGRGITVCERWQGENGFVNFLADMGPRPERTSLDRIDTNGNYEPGNCRWATKQQQQANRRDSRILEFRGKRHCLDEFARIVGLSPRTVRTRLRRGWSVDRALATPAKKKNKRIAYSK